MNPVQRQAFDFEIAEAKRQIATKQWAASLHHLERAHVIAQMYVWPHVRSHALMLNVEMRRGRPLAAIGQVTRIVLGALGSAVGIVPVGNTGGSDIGMFKSMPITPDIQRVIDGERGNVKNNSGSR